MDLMRSFFRVPDQHMRRCMTNPPVGETTINQHYHQQIIWILGVVKSIFFESVPKVKLDFHPRYMLLFIPKQI